MSHTRYLAHNDDGVLLILHNFDWSGEATIRRLDEDRETVDEMTVPAKWLEPHFAKRDSEMEMIGGIAMALSGVEPGGEWSELAHRAYELYQQANDKEANQ